MMLGQTQSLMLTVLGVATGLSMGSMGCAGNSGRAADTAVPLDGTDLAVGPDVASRDQREPDDANELSTGDLQDALLDADGAAQPDLRTPDSSDFDEFADSDSGPCPAEAPILRGGGCVQCLKGSDCPLSEHVCLDHTCIPAASAPEECRFCAYASLLCGIPPGGDGFFCAQCLEDADCPVDTGCDPYLHSCCPLILGNAQCGGEAMFGIYCQTDLQCDESPFIGHSICDATQDPFGLCVNPDGFCDGIVGHCFGLQGCFSKLHLEGCIELGYPAIYDFAPDGNTPGGFCSCTDGWTDRESLKACLVSGGDSPACLSSECYYGVCVSSALLHLPQETYLAGEIGPVCWAMDPLCVPPGPLLEFLFAEDAMLLESAP